MNTPNETSRPSEPPFLPILRLLWKARLLLFSIVLLFAALFGVYAFLAPKVYRSDVVLAPARDDEQGGALASVLDKVGGLAALAGGGFRPGKQSDEGVAVMRSRALGEQFIRDQGLMPILFEDKWDAKAKAWKRNVAGKEPTIQDGYKIFDNEIRSVSVDQKSGLITLTIRWHDPVLAQRWASELVSSVNRKMRSAEISESRANLAFLDKELKQTTVVEIQLAIYRLVEAQTRRMMLANVREEFAFRVVDPPIAPDANKYESPRKPLLVLLGAVIGFLFSSMGVLAYRLRASIRE